MFIRLLFISLLLLCVVMGVHYLKREFGIGPGLPKLTASWQTQSPQPSPPMPTAALSASSSAQQESVQQRLGNLLAIPLQLDADGVASDSVSLAYVRENQPLMVVLFGTDISATAAASVIAQLRALPTPPVIAVDHEGGTVQRLAGSGFTQLPSWQQLCSMQAELRKDLLASSAAQLKQAGVDVILGPTVDRAASGSALGSRNCSSDPDTVITVAQELIALYQHAGVTPMLKHYPGIGAARTDLHLQSAKIQITPDDTRPFEILLAVNPQLPVMISHIRVDPADPNSPCSMSYLCVGELHRVFPDALLVSDALEMRAAGYLATSSATLRPVPERASASLRAGMDLLLFGPGVTELELDQIKQQLEKDFTIDGKLDNRSLTHIARNLQWRMSLQE